MGTRACIVFALITKDLQEFQRIVWKPHDGFPENVKQELNDFYHYLIQNHPNDKEKLTFVINKFVELYPNYQITENWWLHDYFYYVSIIQSNENIDWSIDYMRWQILEQRTLFCKP